MNENQRRFEVQFKKDMETTFEQMRTIVRAVALKALTSVVLRTPVDTGRARGNWLVSIGDAEFRVTTDTDPDGSVTISNGSQVIAEYKNTGEELPSIIIHNSLPYINRLENGYSDQAPSGMVGLTVAELQVIPTT